MYAWFPQRQTGFPRRLENLENKNGHGKSWNMQIGLKSWNIVISHEILPILPILLPNCVKICMFFAITEKLSIRVESSPFPMFAAKCRECKMEKRNGHGKVMEKSWKNISGTLTREGARTGKEMICCTMQ